MLYFDEIHEHWKVPLEVKNAAVAYLRDWLGWFGGKEYAEDCKDLMDGARRAKHMFTGLGKIGGGGITHSFNALVEKLGIAKTLKELAAVGECCYQPFTIRGELSEQTRARDSRANLIYVDPAGINRRN